MARVSFDSIFSVDLNTNSLEPKQRIRVGGVEFGPGVKFTKGVAFAGIDFTQFIGKDLEIKTDDNVIVITGIYQYAEGETRNINI